MIEVLILDVDIILDVTNEEDWCNVLKIIIDGRIAWCIMDCIELVEMVKNAENPKARHRPKSSNNRNNHEHRFLSLSSRAE